MMKVPVRYFTITVDEETGDIEETECSELDFIEAEGVIEYERHTVFQNGVSQICLTKNPYGG